MSEKHKKVCRALKYFLAFVSNVASCASLSVFCFIS